jgi:nucleotide-binding universal stress UspA family protein
MFRNVIAGVDGTPNGRDAAHLASALVSHGGTLTLVNVHADEHVYQYGSSDFGEIVRQDALDLLAKAREAGSLDAELATIGASSVGAGLHKIAAQLHADLLVVGSCGRGVAGRLLLGDDMRASLDGAPCDVAVAPQGYSEKHPAFVTIGVAYDDSPEATDALELARELAREHGASISALTVVNVPTYSYGTLAAVNWAVVLNDLQREAHERLDTVDDLDGHVVRGDTNEELTKFADSVDLLVTGSRGYGPTRRLVFGSKSRHLASTASCPLLVSKRVAESDITPPVAALASTSRQ